MKAEASLVAAAFAAVVVGCGGSDDKGVPIRADRAYQAIVATFERPVVDNVITGPEATTTHVVASFTGGSELEHLVAVVFDRPSGSRVLTGDRGARRIAGTNLVVIRVANVVVLYSRAPGVVNRTAAFRSALRDAAGPVR